MSNPITGAYIESQDKKSKNPEQENASQKMGLEALMSIPGAFVTAAFESGIQTPANGLMQLFNPKEAQALKVVTSHKEKMGSGEWFAQLGGSALGSLGNYVLLSKSLKVGGECIKFAGASSASKFWRPIANIIDKGENSKILNNPLGTAFGTGAFYGGVLTPVNPDSENMTLERSKNAVVGGLSVMALVAPNRVRLNVNAIKEGHGSRFHEVAATTAGGMLAGMTNVGFRSLLDGKAMNPQDASETFLAYSVLGAGYGAYRGLSRTEKPMELKQEEATDKLLAVRRTLEKPKRSTEEMAKCTRQEWKAAVKQMDQNICTNIRDSQLPLDTQLSLTTLHKTQFNSLLANPRNNRVPEPFIEHEFGMQDLVANAIKQEQVATSRQIEQSITRQALNRWTKKPAQEISEQEHHNLPAKLDQVNAAESKLPATGEQKSYSQVPATFEDATPRDFQSAATTDLVPQGAVDLRTGFLGNRINTTKLEMSNAKSTVAKRANMNTARQQQKQQHDLAETLCSGLGKLKLTHTTFEKYGHTPEQANRKALVDRITTTSDETAAGIGNAQELNKDRAKPWNNEVDEPPTPGI